MHFESRNISVDDVNTHYLSGGTGSPLVLIHGAGSVGTGNLTTWRRVGTNHHIEKVVQDVSSLFASSDTP